MKKEKIETSNAPKAIGPYSQAIRTGDLIFTSGQIPIDPKTNELIDDSFENQTILVFKNIEQILKASGSSLDNVIKVNVYISDLNLFPRFNEIYQKFFNPPYPARTTIEGKLPKNSPVEIDVIAAV